MKLTRPQDLPRIRNEVVQWLNWPLDRVETAANGDQFVCASARTLIEKRFREDPEDYEWMIVNSTDPRAIDLWMDCLKRISSATLYHVSAEMVDLAQVAERSLPDFQLAAQDLPSESGFMHLGAILDHATTYNDDAPAEARAVSWHTHKKGVHFTFWDDADLIAQFMHDRHGLPFFSPSPLVPAPKEMVLPFSDAEGWEEIREGLFYGQRYAQLSPDVMMHRAGITKTLWLLMQQELTSDEPAHYDRATRRRAARERYELPEVRVIQLRRVRHNDPASEGSSREYYHRWLVRGHWRQHWYPKRQVHRPVWITPHIKGPDDAPLIGGEKVYALHR